MHGGSTLRMILLAIDPSLSSTGFAVFDEDGNLIECGKIKTGPTTSEEDRLVKISNKMRGIVETTCHCSLISCKTRQSLLQLKMQIQCSIQKTTT